MKSTQTLKLEIEVTYDIPARCPIAQTLAEMKYNLNAIAVRAAGEGLFTMFHPDVEVADWDCQVYRKTNAH